MATTDPAERLIGQTLIDLIDEAGYLTEPLDAVAERLGVSLSRVEKVLELIHGFDPSGIGARNLAECLAIQLREADRLDPAMAALVKHLELLARRDFAGLKRVCGVDDEDLADMVAEVRRLDPKPGLRFGGAPIQPVVPDVYVRAGADGGWIVELNSDVLPRVLVNQTYLATVSKAARSEPEKTYITDCLQTANWLTRSLEQRAKTILKVATEIVRQQDGFLTLGVEHLRPLNLRTVADAIGMHESTVSRVTSNKYVSTPRGVFEMKYFFTAAIAGTKGGGRAFGGIRASPHQADDRRGGRRRRALRRRDRPEAARRRHRHRSPHRRQVSGRDEDSVLGRASAGEDGAARSARVRGRTRPH